MYTVRRCVLYSGTSRLGVGCTVYEDTFCIVERVEQDQDVKFRRMRSV